MPAQAIDFGNIRILSGSQRDGFEQLCVQLFEGLSGEPLVEVTRFRGAGGDSGVEAIATGAASQNLVGLQSKYFSTELGAPQWTQIDKSVRTAAGNYSQMSRYLVCVNRDRTQAANEKWTRLLADWKESFPDLTVEWLGASELRAQLVKPTYAYLEHYWFGTPEFSAEWMASVCKTSIEQLHQRYTPTLHQTTNAERQLGLVLADPTMLRDYHERCVDVAKSLRDLRSEDNFRTVLAAQLQIGQDMVDNLQDVIDRMMVEFRDGDMLAQTAEFIPTLDMLEHALDNISRVARADAQGLEDGGALTRTALRTLSDKAGAPLEGLAAVRRQIATYEKARDNRLSLLIGEGGAGKSHLLATVTERLLQEGRGCIFVVGERFKTAELPAKAISGIIGWPLSMPALLECMQAHAQAVGKTSVILVDAINESTDKSVWRADLRSLRALLKSYPDVQMIVSCRSDWLSVCVPPGLAEELVTIPHYGFDLDFHAAVTAYFKGYNVNASLYPPFLPEFTNPLFLKTLCEAYKNRTLPAEPIAFVDVLNEWEEVLAQGIEVAIDCPVAATKAAMSEIVTGLAESADRTIPEATAMAICKKHFGSDQTSRSLYKHLCSSGLLQDINEEQGTVVRLQYERFSDVRIAQMELAGCQTRDEWLAYWSRRLIPSFCFKSGMRYDLDPQLFAYALLLPIKFNLELIDCPVDSAPERYQKTYLEQQLWMCWLDALPWRKSSTIGQAHVDAFLKWGSQVSDPAMVWERLLQVSTVVNHPLNARFLHAQLIAMPLPDREGNWTIPMADHGISEDRGGWLRDYLAWASQAADLASPDQAYLAALVLIWLTSSNHTKLRDTATNVAIRVLRNKPEQLQQVLQDFWEVDDPYVKERLLAVAAGVVPTITNPAAIGQLARFVLERFYTPLPPLHLLQREYARFIVEFAVHKGAIESNALERIKGPFKSPVPEVWDEAKVKEYEDDNGYSSIRHSLRPEEMGMYGDFGRYTMGSAVHNFWEPAGVAPTADEPQMLHWKTGMQDARIARRYIWKRVVELGWTPARFHEYERHVRGHDRGEPETERISKKYQWIGLHEYLGYLSDHKEYKNWRDIRVPFDGAWQIYGRDYDPSLAPWLSSGVYTPLSPDPVRQQFPSPVPVARTTAERQAWVQAQYNAFTEYLSKPIDGDRWLVVYAHNSFQEKPAFGLDRFNTETMTQWIDVRALVIPNADFQGAVDELSGQEFYGEGIDIPKADELWITEYPWVNRLAAVNEDCAENDTWFRDMQRTFYLTVCQIGSEERRFVVPAPSLYAAAERALGGPLSAIRPGGPFGYQIVDSTGKPHFLGTTSSYSLCVVRESTLRRCAEVMNGTIAWAVLSERDSWDGHNHTGGISNQSGVYWLRKDGVISGGLTVHRAHPGY